jgi:hypothetical protein
MFETVVKESRSRTTVGRSSPIPDSENPTLESVVWEKHETRQKKRKKRQVSSTAAGKRGTWMELWNLKILTFMIEREHVGGYGRCFGPPESREISYENNRPTRFFW